MKNIDNHRQLTQLCQRLIGKLSELLQIMQQEYTALEQNDLPAFESVVGEKQQLTGQVEQMGQDLASFLARMGIDLNRQGIGDFLQQCSPQQNQLLAPLWDQLQAVAQQCRHQNLVNGKIVEQNQTNIKMIFKMLHNQLVDNDELYGPTGKSVGTPTSRPLAEI